MKLRLDTHAFLWFIDDSPLLSARGKALLEADNDLLLSIGSLWEIAIKVCLGKLTVAMPSITNDRDFRRVEGLPVVVLEDLLR